MDRAFQVLAQDDPDADLAALAAQIGRFMFFRGDHVLALERTETALDMAEALGLPEVMSSGLNTKAIILISHERPREGLTLLRYALEIALESDKPSAALRAYYNLADSLARVDRFEEAVSSVREGLALARRVGNRYWEWTFAGQAYPFFALGLWDEALELCDTLPTEDWSQARLAFGGPPTTLVPLYVHRGQVGEAQELLTMLAELELATSADMQEFTSHASGSARLALVTGKPDEALAFAETALGRREQIGISSETMKESLVTAVEAAFELRDLDKVGELLAIVDALPPGRSPQFLQAHASRFRARLADRQGDPEEAERLFKRAGGLFRELAIPFYLAVILLEQGEWLAAQGRNDEAERPIAEAETIFVQLQATPWLERAGALAHARA